MLEDLVDHKTVGPIHVTRLRKFIFDTTREDAEEIATHDTNEFYVEAVIDHEPKSRPDRHRRELRFLIKWAGYDESRNSWIPWTGNNSNRVIHDYLRSIGMGSIVSKRYNEL